MLAYGSFTITPRTFQIRGSGQWTLDLVISRRATARTFSAPTTFPTEKAAIDGCYRFGRKIIDGQVPHCSVADLL